MFRAIPWLLLLAVVALVWWRQMGARSTARSAAMRACADAEVIFIDELAFRRIGITRDDQGSLRLTRYYHFEFYQRGDRRYSGSVELYGQYVNRVCMGPRPL